MKLKLLNDDNNINLLEKPIIAELKKSGFEVDILPSGCSKFLDKNWNLIIGNTKVTNE